MVELAILLPLISSLAAGIGMIACLLIGFSNDNISRPPWPYVSDTGATPPESCLFALIFNWCAVAFIFVTVFYYKYLAQHGYQCTLNKVAVIVSIVAGAGFSLVGCFQYTQVLVVHTIGAVLALAGGNLYAWMIVVINAKYLKKSIAPNWLLATRALLATLQSVSLLIFLVLVCMEFDDDTLFTIMTSFEWAGTYLLLSYIGFFSFDFAKVKSFHFHLKATDLISVVPNEGTEMRTDFTQHHHGYESSKTQP